MRGNATNNRSNRREEVADRLAMLATSSRRLLRFVLIRVALVSSCGMVAFAAWAQFGNSGVVRGFKFPEFFERAPGQTNRVLKTLITGSEARPAAEGYDVKDMKIETFEESGSTNIIARAPQCNVDLSRRVVWSTGRLEVATANGQFWTEGNEGFFCRMSNTVVILSNRVRTVINRQLIQERTHENKTN